RKAVLTAGFTYVQFALAIVTGLVLIPLTIRHLGLRDYGLWLTSGELLAYLALGDFGVFAVLPWLIAGADGRGDVTTLRRLLATAVAVGVGVAVLILAVGVAAWYSLPAMLNLSEA